MRDREGRLSGSACVPVSCAWAQTVRMSVSTRVWSMCVTLCLSDGQSKYSWVGAVCASLSRCSALQWVTVLSSSLQTLHTLIPTFFSSAPPPPPPCNLFHYFSPSVCLQPRALLAQHSSLIHRYLSPLICSLNGPVEADILQNDLASPQEKGEKRGGWRGRWVGKYGGVEGGGVKRVWNLKLKWMHESPSVKNGSLNAYRLAWSRTHLMSSLTGQINCIRNTVTPAI